MRPNLQAASESGLLRFIISKAEINRNLSANIASFMLL